MRNAREWEELLCNIPNEDAPPWFEIGPQEHGQSDVGTLNSRFGPLDRDTAEFIAAAPHAVADLIRLIRGVSGVIDLINDREEALRLAGHGTAAELVSDLGGHLQLLLTGKDPR